MFNSPQWINWQPVQIPGEPKPRKVPSDGVNQITYQKVGDNVIILGGINHLNPVNWVDLDTAAARSQLVGFVLTENDNYFVVDIDHALQPDGTWSPLALAVCTMFPGAYVEVSYSGDGLHIFAQGVMPDGFKHKNSALGLETYDRARYIAVTCTGANGTPDINHQAALDAFCAAYMEKSMVSVNPLHWTTGPRPEWNGPEDDDELINKILTSRPSANSLWNGTATFKDLWKNNTEVFVDCYPDTSTVGYDLSKPDMALATHLAFWTGGDCERIARLMLRSALVRPKWTEHPTYLKEFTITKAVASCQNVYNDPRTANTLAPPPPPPAAQGTPTTSTGVIRQGLQYLTPDAQIEHFKGCVYVINTHRVIRPNGSLISPEQFKVIYGGYEFSMDAQNFKSTKCAWEAFTKSQAIRFPIVEGVLFRPEMAPGAILSHEGLDYVNSYQPVPVRRIEGDMAPFFDLLDKLFPDENDRAIMLAYMAACVQHIGVKFQWCPLIQGEEGNGKSFFMRAIIYAVGDRLSHLVNPKDIANKFNAWIEGKVFAGIEEVYVSDKRDLLDSLKIMITNDRLEIQPKGGNQYMGDNRANFMMNTNHQDAIRKTKNDRRYAPFFTPQQSYADILRDGMGGQYFPELYKWAKVDGYAIVANYLMTYEIPDALNPATMCHRAPQTSSTKAAIEVSQGPVEQEIANAVGEQLQGFRGGWISAKKLDELLIRTGKARLIALNKRTKMLEAMGYIKVARSTVQIIQEGGRPILYALKGTIMTEDIAGCYTKAQGYFI